MGQLKWPQIHGYNSFDCVTADLQDEHERNIDTDGTDHQPAMENISSFAEVNSKAHQKVGESGSPNIGRGENGQYCSHSDG